MDVLIAANMFDVLKGLLPAGREQAFLLVLVIGVLAAAAAIVTFLILRSCERRRHIWTAFRDKAERIGLTEEEQNLAAAVARLAGVRDPSLVFTVEPLFDRGVTALAESDPLEKWQSQSPWTPCSTCLFLSSLREKLGFPARLEQTRPSSVDVGPIPEGTILTILRQRSPQSFQAVVAAKRPRQSELLVASEEALEANLGESWTVRYAEGRVMWEFSAWVVGKEQDLVTIRPRGEARSINRRKFARVSIDRPAYVAAFPFAPGSEGVEPPEFHPATVTEIGGPGLLLEAPIQAEPGQKVLVVLELENGHAVEGMGIVRRVRSASEGASTMAIELMGLNTAEISELTRETNAAARKDPGARRTPMRRGPRKPIRQLSVNQEGNSPAEAEATRAD